jgi:hypothetical protein
MTILYWTIFAACLAWYLWNKRRDWSKSALQPLHLPPGEQNFLTKGKDGYFSATKSYIVNGIVIAVFTVAAIFVPWEYAPILVGGMFAAWGFYVMDGIRKDLERLEANKLRQLTILGNLKRDPEGDYVPDPKPKGFGKSIVWVSGTFYDFHVVPQVTIVNGDVWSQEMFEDQARAKGIITSKLLALSKLPESQWFVVGRAK